jgi:hypothetical protein
MQAKLAITQSPQILAGDALRPAAPTLRKLTSILAAYLRSIHLLGAAFPLGGPSDGIIQTVQQSRTLSSKEKVEFHIYLTRW